MVAKVADTPKRRDFDAVMDELREELRGQLVGAVRFDAPFFDGPVFAEPTIDVMQRFAPALDAAVLAEPTVEVKPRFAPALDSAMLRDRTGDTSVLCDSSGNLLKWVKLRQAQIYSGKSARHIRRLISDGVLPARGSKGNRRVSSEILIQLFPPNE